MVKLFFSTGVLVTYVWFAGLQVDIWAMQISYSLWWISIFYSMLGMLLTGMNISFWLRRQGIMFERSPAAYVGSNGEICQVGYIPVSFMMIHTICAFGCAAIYFMASGFAEVSVSELRLLFLNAWFNMSQSVTDFWNWHPSVEVRSNTIVIDTMLLHLLWSPMYWLLAMASNRQYFSIKRMQLVPSAERPWSGR